jgi:hypothetical protein
VRAVRALVAAGLLAAAADTAAVGILSAAGTGAAEPSGNANTPADAASPLDSGRATLAKWVETQQIISAEKKDWQQGREMLQARIDLVRGEIAAVEEKLREQRTEGSETVGKLADLDHESATLQSAGVALAGWATELENGLNALQPQLPEPLQTKLGPLYGRMPKDPKNTTVSLAERFQNVVGILNEVNKFNGEITMVNEVRPIADGKPAEVRTVYVGLAQAYYLSAGGEAGFGRPTPEGWRWEPARDMAPAISEVVEILQNKAKPAFVRLPVKVQ